MATDLLELVARIRFDSKDYEKGIKGAESKASKFGEGVKKAGKVAIAGFTAVAGAVTAIGTKAVQSYADYEQLVGGVETLFGKSADVVKGYADEAYKTAGLSANEYMETVTSFSASLLQSLGGDTAKASESANQAIIDMSDNANKMGTSMESIQNAYQGFAKQNYTMLDNLKLGYGGTKEEMQRLLTDAEKLTGKKYDVSNFNDITEAIHAVQTEMGITGTTAKEASTTISGSLGSLKSAWQNVLIGIADDNQDFDALLDNLVDSVVTFGKNIIPRVETALGGVGKLVQGLGEKVLPMIIEQFPTILDSLLPAVMSTIDTLLNSVVNALPSIINILLNIIPQLLDIGLQLILALANGITDSLPTLIPALVNVIDQIVDKLTNPDTLAQLIGVALALILALTEGLINAIPKLVMQVPKIIDGIKRALIQALPSILNAGVRIIGELVRGILSVKNSVKLAFAQIFKDTIVRIKDFIKKFPQWGRDMVDGFVSGIKQSFKKFKNTIKSLADIAKSMLHFSVPDEGPLADADTYMPDMIDLFAQGIDRNKYRLANSVEGLAGTMADGMGYDYYYGSSSNKDTVQKFEFSFAEGGNQALNQIARLLLPYMKVALKEAGGTI